jgi:hypothetical protein
MEELTMKTVFAAATGLALVATAAFANPTTGPRTGAVQLRATVADFIGIVSTTNSTIGDLDLVNGTSSIGANNNENNNSGGDQKATVTVLANTRYDIELAWETWDDVATLTNPTPGYPQANYYNSVARCSIGGSIHFDDNVNQDGNASISNPPSGATPWTLTDFSPGRRTYGIGSNLDPIHTNCDDGIAAPGTYALNVAITLTKNNRP